MGGNSSSLTEKYGLKELSVPVVRTPVKDADDKRRSSSGRTVRKKKFFDETSEEEEEEEKETESPKAPSSKGRRRFDQFYFKVLESA